MTKIDTPIQEAATPPKYSCDVCGDGFDTPQQKAGHVRKTGHRSPPKDAPPKTDTAGKKSLIEQRLTEFVAWAGLGMALKDPVKGKHMVQRAPYFARAWDNLAKENDAVRKTLEMLVTSGVWAVAVTETLALFAPWIIDSVPPDARPFVATGLGFKLDGQGQAKSKVKAPEDEKRAA